LVRQFLQEAQSSSRALVLEGSCHPQESVPYKALDALIDNLARHLLGLDGRAVLALAPRHAAALLYVFPVLGRVPAVREWPAPSTEQSPAELRRQGVDALRELIGKLADQQIVVLSIDDIQWSDRDSGVMLRALLTPPDAPRLLLLLTSRDDQAQAPLLEAFANVVTTVDLKLERLTTPESLTLARDLARGMSLSADTDSIAAEAGGSPFLLGELVRYFHERRSESAVLPPLTVADVVKWRFQHLSHDARRLLEVVAIAGRPLETSLALEVAGIGRAGRLLAYSLCSDCLLRITTQDEQGFLETYHDRFRQFAIAELAPEEKRHHHHVLADAIRAGRNPDARALVEHYLAADEHGEASRFALIAAHEAERDLAFDQAVDMYDVALKFRMGAATDPEVLERRAQMLANAARRTEAAHAYEATARVIANVNSEARTALRVQAAEQFFYGGELRQGLSVLEGVLGDIGIRLPAAPLARSIGGQWRRAKFIVRGSRVSARDPSTIKPDTRARLDALWRVTRGVVMLDPALADVLAGTHLLESLRCGDASRSLRAIGLEAAFEANIGGRWFRERSRFLLQEADLTAAQTGDPYDLAWLAHCRAACAWFDGRWLECVSLGGDAESRLKAAGAGTSWELAVLYGFVLSALANLGRLKDLSRKVSELVTDAERRQDQYALRVFQTGDAVMMWLAADRAKEALQVADQTLRDYPTNRFTSQHRHHFVAAVQSLLYAGEFEQAWAQVERSWVPLRWSGFLLLDCLGTQLRYLRACAALALARAPSCGRPAHLLRIARRETRRIRRSTLPMASPMADAIEAGIAGAERRRDTQIRALRAASNGFDRADMALHREAALWHLASLRSDLTEGGNDGAAWMEQHGIVRPASMARAVVPAA
jgi:hypothetical protein